MSPAWSALGDTYILRPPSELKELRIFLSSTNEVVEHRDFLQALVAEATNGIRASEWGKTLRPQLSVIRWEDELGSKTRGKSTNAQFVRLARHSHITVVILRDRLGSGTKEEIEAVLKARGVQVEIIWIQPKDGRIQRPLKLFMTSHADRAYWNTINNESISDVAQIFVRLIAAATVDLVRSFDSMLEDFDEQR